MYRIPITPRIKQLMSRYLGAEFDSSKYSVYEIMANNSAVIAKSSDIWKNSRMSKNYLLQMTNTAQSHYIPLIELHDKYGRLPIGRIFDAEVFDNNSGLSELHVLAYLPKDDSPNALDSKIASGIVNEVSSGTTPSHLYCSACNFHYTKDDNSAKYLNLDWDPFSGEPPRMPKCPDGHEVGVNGVGLVLNDLKEWAELSVVTRGAVTSARFLKQEEWKLASKTEILHLAASSKLDKLHFNAHTEIPINKRTPEGKPMTDITVPLAEYNAKVQDAALYGAAKSEKERLETLVQDLNAKNATLTQQLADKDAALTTKDTELQTKVTELAAATTDLQAKEADVTRLTTELAAAQVPDGGAGKQPGAPEANLQVADLDDFKRIK